ncbi:MAG: SGNH/GDSL hydrolase family protein, partial [Okeania sp. SIO2H7]|nr:SGNH/GDSL hydrolase family protein [Okeania sp. SIO2H7]
LTPKEVNSSGLTTVDKLPAWLVNNSRILQVAKKVEMDYKLRMFSKEYDRLVKNNFRPPPDAVWQETWEVTEGLIALMAEEVEEKKADFFVVFIPDPKQVHYDRLDRLRYMRENQIDDLLYPNKRVKDWGDRYGFPVIDLTERFQVYAEENEACLHGFENSALCVGHWNVEGHRLAARIIRKQICRQLTINNNN